MPEAVYVTRCLWAGARCGRAGSFGRRGSRNIRGPRSRLGRLEKRKKLVTSEHSLMISHKFGQMLNVSCLSIWIDSKPIVWDSSVVFTDNSY